MTEEDINNRVLMIRAADTLTSAKFYLIQILKMACKEQRELCAKQEDYYGVDADGTSCIYEHRIEEQILSAPEPKLD